MWLASSSFRPSLCRANVKKGDKYGSMDRFDLYIHMFSLCLPPHHHQQWNPQRWARRRRRRPKAAASIVGDGEAANIAKTYAYTHQLCPYFHICHLSYYLPYVSSVKIRYSPTTSMHLDTSWTLAKFEEPWPHGLQVMQTSPHGLQAFHN